MHPFCLRKTTIQPRLFQQACRLASTRRKVVKPRPTILHQQTSPQIRQTENHDVDEEESIRWFEKDVATGAIRRVAGNPEEREANELRQKIKALEDELREYKAESSNRSLMAALSPAERAKVELAMRKRNDSEQELTSGLEISLELPPLSVPLLKRLNTSLREATLNPDSVVRRKDLWRWYSRAKHNIPALPRMIPTRAWDVLWETQTVDSPTNPERLQHMGQILEDMVSGGCTLTEEQKVIYIETLLRLGDTHQAVQRWEDEYEASDPSPATLRLGISVFNKTGDLDRAQRILHEYLGAYPREDPHVILVLIASNVKLGNDHMAFALYLLLRSKLGRKITMDDYDAVALQFLNNDKKDLALAVFRDMMLHGTESMQKGFLNKSKESELYRAISDRLHLLRSTSTNADEVNAISLSALGALPPQWQNKYFYASWMKKLIGLGQLDAASKVVEIMYERGVEPDTKHMNGLMGAFLRSNDSALQERGVEIGWSMIQQRLDFTWRRRENNRQAPQARISVYKSVENLEHPLHVSRPMPRASIETFNVLVLHCVVKQKWSHVHHLHRMLRPAEIKMDAFFMNHLLQTELYSKGEQSAWRRFIKYARSVSPDIETYNCLWTAELRHLESTKSQDPTGFPLPRQLFSVMLTWLSSMDAKSKAAAREMFDLEMYGKILQSFCVGKDLSGCLVAVHAIAQHLGHYPDHDVARIVTTAVSNLPETHVPTAKLGRRSRQQLTVSQARLKNTASVLKALSNRRAQVAMEHGIDLERLTPEERAEENVNLLSEFIRVVLVRSFDGPDVVEKSIERAAQEMGIPGINTGDVDASNVS